MCVVQDIETIEGGAATAKAYVEAFARLIKSGTAFQLQGFYGRNALRLIERGLITSDGEITAEGRERIEEGI